MSEWIIKLLLIAFAGWVVWKIAESRYIFRILVEDGNPHLHKGKVTQAFLGRISSVCQEHSISKGWIKGVPDGKHIALRFSRHFPEEVQQRLRNEWQVTR